MSSILILKTAALGDVLRTTSILPGLHARYHDCRITWVTARGAADLLRTHPLVSALEIVDPASQTSVDALQRRLAPTRWTRVISLDDERPMCALASSLDAEKLSGAHLDLSGRPAYTPDVAAWFDMGLLSTFGKEAADRMKVANTKSHPRIYAEMLGIPMGKPALHLPEESRAFGRTFARDHALHANGVLVGLNTGAGGRWLSKQLPVERTIDLSRALSEHLGGRVTFLVMGGEAEVERSRAILAGMSRAAPALRAVDAGNRNTLLDFAALVGECDLVVSSDSLALHMAISQDVRVVAFFAPTSAAEIELYGLGQKIASTSADYCSYRADADNSTITVERLRDAAIGELAAHGKLAARGGSRRERER